MKYKKWSLCQKLGILTFSKKIDIIKTIQKHSESYRSFYNWEKKFNYKDESCLKYLS